LPSIPSWLLTLPGRRARVVARGGDFDVPAGRAGVVLEDEAALARADDLALRAGVLVLETQAQLSFPGAPVRAARGRRFVLATLTVMEALGARANTGLALVGRSTDTLSPVAEENSHPSVRILIADDQALVRAGFKMILDAEHDLDVVGEASDGAQAVAMANALEPQVVLMDIRMPELDGIEATRRILAAAGERPVRVLMLTTFDLNEYVYEALRAGASGFLLKDVPPEQLVAGIRVVAEGEALLAPSITRRLIQEFASAAPTPAELPRGLDELTARELEVFKLLARGLSNAEIAEALVVSETTVKTHVARVLMKLGLRDRVQAVVLAYESGVAVPGRGG
jgi:DNA-binding NarL/FixJ family response regulator